MSDFGETWRLTRKRFDDAVLDLNEQQLRFRLHPDALTLGEMAIHVAGVEVSFIAQMTGLPLDPELDRVRAASTDGVVNDSAFPFTPEEITVERVRWALDTAAQLVAAHIDDPDPWRAATLKSALGPMIDGTGAFARLAYHPGYHQGQAQLVRSAPGFPK